MQGVRLTSWGRISSLMLLLLYKAGTFTNAARSLPFACMRVGGGNEGACWIRKRKQDQPLRTDDGGIMSGAWIALLLLITQPHTNTSSTAHQHRDVKTKPKDLCVKQDAGFLVFVLESQHHLHASTS